MATVEIPASYNASIYGRHLDGDYDYAHSTKYSRSTATVQGSCGQNYTGAGSNDYYVYRWVLSFDTSSLSGNTVTGVALRMAVTSDYTDTDVDFQVVKCDWSAYDIANNVSADVEAAYDLILSADADDNILFNSSGISTNTPYTSGALSTAWVNTAGSTYYALRTSTDASATTPTNSEYLLFAGYLNGTEAYRPTLVVDYTEGGGGSSTPIRFLHHSAQPFTVYNKFTRIHHS